ncbi:MAG: AAA family ATPase, partial [Methanosarcinales archaeon]|nr:AAA family ATPase [Methanosarcinales archaeon]
MIEWAEKYRPTVLSEVVGNKKAVETLHAWATDWENGNVKHPAALLYGRAGCGKTSAAHALATDMGWDAIELNASDQRTADVIKKVAGSASSTRTFSGLRRLVILDEADNIHGTSDRGGAKAVTEIVKKTSQPIILIANDAYGISD